MAHFAHVDESGIVDNVIVADQDFINSGHVGDPAEWVQTSYNTYGGIHYNQATNLPDGAGLRKNFAGLGYAYDPVRDAFIPPSPGDGYILNEETCNWELPVE